MVQAVVDRIYAESDAVGDGIGADRPSDLATAMKILADAATRLAEAGGPSGLTFSRLADDLARLAREGRPDDEAILAASPRFAAASCGARTAIEAIAGLPESEADRVRLAILLLRACVWNRPGVPVARR